MTRPTDDILMAYADDELDDAEMARVEAYLTTDAGARDLVEMFRRTAALSRDACEAALRAPPPRNLIDAILKQPVEPQSSTTEPAGAVGGANVVDLAARRRTVRLSDALRLPIAASLALLVGLGAGYVASLGGASQTGEQLSLGVVTKTAPLAEVLEHRPSGSTTGRHTVVATFRDKEGRACREFELTGSAPKARPEIAAIACRNREGMWTVEGAARLAAVAPVGTGIEPSGVAERDALEGLLNMLGAKLALSPVEEKSLIEGGWK